MSGHSAEGIARVCHEANRAYQHVAGDPAPSPPWDQAPEWQRGSAVAGVREALAGASPRELHDAWCKAQRADGWRFGPVKDETARTHPCLVPYRDLPAEERRKDLLFAAVVSALACTEVAG